MGAVLIDITVVVVVVVVVRRRRPSSSSSFVVVVVVAVRRATVSEDYESELYSTPVGEHPMLTTALGLYYPAQPKIIFSTVHYVLCKTENSVADQQNERMNE